MTSVVVVVQQLRRPVVGGIGTYARGLLAGLAALDDRPQVTLHASRVRGDDPLAATGFPVDAAPVPGRLLTRLWDRGLAPAPRSDVLHATSLAVPPSRGAPVAVMVHDLAWRSVPDAYPPRGRRWHERALARALDRCRLFLVPSEPVAAELVAAGADAARIEVVEEGADHLPPADAAGAQALLDRLGVRDGYLLTVSTLEPRKNLATLIDAYERARPALPEPWPLVVVGPRGWGDALGDVPHGVVVAGEVGDAVLAALYRGARCFVYVPLAEGFGLPPVEAMRECVPVVASTVVPSVGEAALRVDGTDARAVAGALIDAASDDRLRAELVTAGLLRAGELTWRAAAQRHVELWEAMA